MNSVVQLAPARRSKTTRNVLSLVLTAVGAAYLVVALLALLETTPPGSTWPSVGVLDSALFGRRAKPVSPIERLLMAEEGDMNGGGTMRPAFTTESTGWESISKSLSETDRERLLAEREGERLALLEWVRSGASRMAYEQDDHPLSASLAGQPVTSRYIVATSDGESHNPVTPQRVQIRSLINERCASCHSENGREEKARSFPLDNYDDLAYHCRPEPPRVPPAQWLMIAVAAQLPLACLAAACAPLSSLPKTSCAALISLTIATALIGCLAWWLGQPGTIAASVVAISSGIFTLGLIGQLAVAIQDLSSNRSLHQNGLAKVT